MSTHTKNEIISVIRFILFTSTVVSNDDLNPMCTENSAVISVVKQVYSMKILMQ